LVHIVFITHVFLLFMCPMLAAHGTQSLGPSHLVRPSPLPVHCTQTPHLTFSIAVDRLDTSNIYTFISQDTCCTTQLNTTPSVSY
jgi:hypothetical protein